MPPGAFGFWSSLAKFELLLCCISGHQAGGPVGPNEFNVDASLGYRRKINLFGTPVDWNIGLNIRNLVADDELIPIKANADGSYGTVRVPPYRMWMVSNSFRF